MFGTEGYKNEIQKLKALKQVRVLPNSKKLAIKQSILSKLNQSNLAESAEYKNTFWHMRAAWFVTSFGVIFFFVGGTLVASAYTAPGDVLYPVKVLKEKVELNLAPTQSLKTSVKVRHAKERIKELQKLNAKNILKQQIKLTASSTSISGFVNNPDAGVDVLNNQQEAVKNEAARQVEDALEDLKIQKQKNERSGNKKTSEELKKTIENLSQSAKVEKLKIRFSEEIKEKREKRVEEREKIKNQLDIQSQNKRGIRSNADFRKQDKKENKD
jgi:hypothetical protein